MKVFISWSGDTSRQLAEALRKWLPSALHVVKPYFSPDDIDKGARWENEISKELESSDFGIICLTKDNIEKPWIMFEAGAIAKKFDTSRVCPILFGMDVTYVRGPLSQFQAAKFTKTEIKKLFKTVNSLCGDNKLEADVLEDVFSMWWPRLEQKVKDILANAKPEGEEKPLSEREMLAEILDLSRTTHTVTRRYARSSSFRGSSVILIELTRQLHSIFHLCLNQGYDDALSSIATLARTAEKILDSATTRPLPKSRARLRSIKEAVLDKGDREET